LHSPHEEQHQAGPKRRCDRGRPMTCAQLNERLSDPECASKVFQPKAGELYLVYHKQSQCWLAALLLPLTDLNSVGISATLESLGLSTKAPSCVTYNVNSGEFEWRDEYRDGGTRSHECKFPIIYFSSSVFPDNSATEWVLAEDMRLHDESTLQPSAVPYCGIARAFMKKHTLCRTLGDRAGDLSPLSSTLPVRLFLFTLMVINPGPYRRTEREPRDGNPTTSQTASAASHVPELANPSAYAMHLRLARYLYPTSQYQHTREERRRQTASSYRHT
jgi:hypothetical protein